MTNEHENKIARVMIAGAVMLALFVLGFAMSLRAEAAVLFTETNTNASTVTINNASSYSIAQVIDCALVDGDISSVTLFNLSGGGTSTSTSEFRYFVDGAAAYSTSSRNSIRSADGFVNKTYTFSPTIPCPSGRFRTLWFALSTQGSGTIVQMRGFTKLIAQRYDGTGNTNLANASMYLQLDGTAYVAAPDEPTAATSTDPAATVQFAFLSLWTVIGIGFVTFVIVNHK